jgi:hypothetical protein
VTAVRAALILACAWLVAACSNDSNGDPSPIEQDAGSDTGVSCSIEVPQSCPATAPTYHDEIAPLIQSKCVPCHGPGGIEESISFTTYKPIYSRRFDVLQRVAHCVMPPADAGVAEQLDSSERELLAAWVVCGAPE